MRYHSPIQQLGGTKAIHTHVGSFSNREQDIADFLEHQDGKIQFALSDKKLGLRVKKELKSRGRSVRYIEPKNTATILHNNLIEKEGNLVIVGNELYVTKGIQDIEGFSERDYERPQFDDTSGMLPPKLARIMVNLTGVKKDQNLLDPFCGSGTLLIEALSLGIKHVTGTDKSEKAIQDSKQNTNWFLQTLPHADTYSVTVGVRDVAKLHKQFVHSGTKFHAIAAEPYMGVPLTGRQSNEFLENQSIELADLYIKAFREFKKVLHNNATIIFIIPRFKTSNGWITIKCLDDIKKMGFTHVPFTDENTTLLYHRPDQFVGRELFKFTLTNAQ